MQLTHGLDKTVDQLSAQSEEFRAEIRTFLDGLISHYLFDGGKLIVAHAGLKEQYQGRSSGRIRNFCLYGNTTGETDEYGLPVRLPWANEYRYVDCDVWYRETFPESSKRTMQRDFATLNSIGYRIYYKHHWEDPDFKDDEQPPGHYYLEDEDILMGMIGEALE